MNNKHAHKWMEELAASTKGKDVKRREFTVRMALAKRIQKNRVEYYMGRLRVHGFLPKKSVA